MSHPEVLYTFCWTHRVIVQDLQVRILENRKQTLWVSYEIFFSQRKIIFFSGNQSIVVHHSSVWSGWTAVCFFRSVLLFFSKRLFKTWLQDTIAYTCPPPPPPGTKFFVCSKCKNRRRPMGFESIYSESVALKSENSTVQILSHKRQQRTAHAVASR
jgi:hypothetical protein